MVQGAETRRFGAAPAALIDEHAQARTEHGQWDAQFDTIAAGHGLPAADDARLIDGHLASEFLGLDPACMHGSGFGRREQILMLRAARIGKGNPDAVAEPGRIEHIHPRRVPHEVGIAHLDQQVHHAFMHAGQQRQLARAVREAAAKGRVVRPLIGIAIQERRGQQRHGLQVVRSGQCRPRVRRQAIQQVGAPLERGRDGLGYGQQ